MDRPRFVGWDTAPAPPAPNHNSQCHGGPLSRVTCFRVTRQEVQHREVVFVLLPRPCTGVQSSCVASPTTGTVCPTSFPNPLNLGMTFNKSLFHDMAAVIGLETRALWLAGCVGRPRSATASPAFLQLAFRFTNPSVAG
jgi:hypothetical protein